ncbi:MOSC N-terminal beta barrel domain-containing protein [Micromonospora coxensis]|uniref:MOSC domain-containing protein n=1 Tax=Micromonospora coxensis TaxID=356852 RepID=UPI0034499C53
MTVTGRVGQLWRYPVKSMLGEALTTATVDARGVAGDRRYALLDRETGRVASAKLPRLWRGLLAVRASGAAPGPVRLDLPDGATRSTDDADLDAVLSRLLGRPVTLTDDPPPDAVLERADPEAVLAAGLDATVPTTHGRVGGAAPPGSLVDFAPVHLLTTATLAAAGGADPVRYRPNLVVESTGDGFAENDWVGRELRIGPELVLRVLAPTPRCAVPTLAHGRLPRDPEALRAPARLNRVVPLPGLDPQPCLGAYATVVRPGRVAVGDPVVPD